MRRPSNWFRRIYVIDWCRSHWIRNFPTYFAAACWSSSLHPIKAPMAVGVMALCAGVLSRRRVLVLVLGGVSVAVLSFNAREGLRPVQSREWVGVLRLVSDPKMFP
ncbi:MAG TPA: hypothetical protein DEB20_01685, partial [Acidimicrobiaceae bacterium]|nr:hypothetical protein [Acidimicrobiaceae bacterium]